MGWIILVILVIVLIIFIIGMGLWNSNEGTPSNEHLYGMTEEEYLKKMMNENEE